MSAEEHEYLLEHFRSSGVFKCFECLYCKREDTHLGPEYKCVHDGVAVHCATKSEHEIMLGCACFWFEPRGTAGASVAERQAEIMRAVRALFGFAEMVTPRTDAGNSPDERQLDKIAGDLWGLGVRL